MSKPQKDNRRAAQVNDQGQRVSRDPDKTVTVAKARAGKFEAAIAALGADDLAVPGLKEALERVRSQAQPRPLDQIQWTQEFVARATKRRVDA